MREHCVKICPLPLNATGPVEVVDVKSKDVSFAEPKNVSRRYRTFPILINGANIATHETSVLVDSEIRDGVPVDPNARACSGMINFFLYRKLGGAMGGTIRCPFTNRCNYGSGSATRNTK